MSSKQKTLFQTWNKDFKDPGPSTSRTSSFNKKKNNTNKTVRKKRNPWEKKPSNQEDDSTNLWKKNINFQEDFADDVIVEETSDVHAGFDVDAGKTWIYPTNYPLREYQFSIVKEALFKNTLVILPTGLGKTFIAAVVMYNMRRWYPNGKVVFMAPTRPLVAQQVDACFKIMGIPQDDTALMTGTMLPVERKRIWQTKHVFFLTPQILTNDLARNICSARSIKCLVVDEAHKALGNHAYCQKTNSSIFRLIQRDHLHTKPPMVVKDLRSRTSQFRILALTATPGGDTVAVRQVLENLLISHVELRTDDCDDIRPYTHERNVEKIVIPLGEDLTSLKQKFLDIITGYLKRLNSRHTVTNRNPSSLSQFFLCKLRDEFNKNPPPNINHYTRGLILADLSLCISLYHAYDLLLLHGVKPFYNFLTGVLNGEKGIPHSRAELQKNADFEEIMQHIRETYAVEGCDEHSVRLNVASTSKAPVNFVPGHPKLVKLKQIVLNHFQTAAGCGGSETRIMIFSQYRDSVKEITEMLKGHEPLIRVMSFVGQSSSANSKGGISQKQQLKIVSEFREGGYNTLVSTCVGEEGLDIGEVDLIICYDAPKSPIRLVQRMGRTGRRREGKIVVLLAEGKEEQMYNSSQYKKKHIYRAIRNGFDQIPLYQNNPVMIPNGIKPQCVKIFMEIEPKRTILTKREKNKLRKISSFLSDDEFQYFCQHYKASDHSLPTLTKPKFLSFLDKKQLKKLVEDEIFGHKESENPVLSVKKWMPWQNVLQPTRIVPHSCKTHTFVNILQLIETPEAAVKHFEYSEDQLRHFETLFPDDRPEDFQGEMQDSNGNALITDESSPRHNSEISVIAEITKKQPFNLHTSYPPHGDSEVASLCNKFDFNISHSDQPEKHLEKTVIMPAPRIMCKPFVINAQSVLEFDVREIVPFESKESLLLSKINGLFSQHNTVADEVMDSQLNDSFFDFAAFDLNFDRDSPPVLVSISPSHADDELAESGRGFSIPKKSQKSLAAEQCDYADKDANQNLDLGSNEENKNVPDVHATDAPASAHAIDVKTNTEQTQYSLTQLASLVDYSEMFADVEKNVDPSLSNVPVDGNVDAFTNFENNVDSSHNNVPDGGNLDDFADVEFESDEEFISPTPPESVKSNCAITGSQLFSYQRIGDLKTRTSQNALDVPDGSREKRTISHEKNKNCSQVKLGNDKNNVCVPPSAANSCKNLQNTQTIDDLEKEFSQPDQVKLRNYKNNVCIPPSAANSCKNLQNTQTIDDLEKEFSQPDQVKLRNYKNNVCISPSAANSCRNLQNTQTIDDLEEEFSQPDQVKLRNYKNNVCISPSAANLCKNLQNAQTIDDLENEFSQADFSEKEIEDSIFFDIAFDSQVPKEEGSPPRNYVVVEDDNAGKTNKNITSEVSGSRLSQIKGATDMVSHFAFSEHISFVGDMDSLLCNETFSHEYHDEHTELPKIIEDWESNNHSDCQRTKTSSIDVAGSSDKSAVNKLLMETTEKIADSVQPETSVVVAAAAAVESTHKNTVNKLARKTRQQNSTVIKEKKPTDCVIVKQVFSPSSDFDDFKIPPRPKKAKPADKGLHAFKSKDIAKEYIISEADVSSDLIHSGSDSASEGSVLDQLEASFIDDDSYIDHQVDQHALYLESIKNHHGLPQKYKLQANNVDPDVDIYSQPPERESSDYLADSFVVENDEIELLTSSNDSVDEEERGRKNKRKRKRIIQPACSSSSEIEDLNCDGDHYPSKMAKFSTNESDENVIFVPRSSTPNSELPTSDFDDFKDVPCLNSPPINTIRKKRRGPVKQLEASCQESEMVYEPAEKQDGYNVMSDVHDPADAGGIDDNANTLLSEKISFDISWTNNQAEWVPDDNALELLRPETSSNVQVENVQKPALSQRSDCLTILIDSKELASGKPIINSLRNQFEINAVVVQLSGADYILSKELAVERLLETEFPASPYHSKAVEKVQTMCQLYDRCCVIIEKDTRKQTLARKPRGKHLEFTLLVLLSTSVKVLHSESPENTAFLLFELAKLENDKRLGINISSSLLSVKKHFLDFCSSIPHVNTICAISFANNFNTLEELLKSSVEDLQRVGHISRQAAYRIHSYFRASMKM